MMPKLHDSKREQFASTFPRGNNLQKCTKQSVYSAWIMLTIHAILLIMCIPYTCLQLHVHVYLYCSDWLKCCDIVYLSYAVSSVYISQPVALLSLFVLAIKSWRPCWYLTVSSLTNCNVELKNVCSCAVQRLFFATPVPVVTIVISLFHNCFT